MDAATALQYAMTALGACIAAIMVWIGQSLTRIDEKLGHVVTEIELHGSRLDRLEEKRREV